MNTLNVSKINWVCVGNSEAETTIVFLHEGLGCIKMWRDYPEQLCLALNVKGIIYDRSGYGESEGSLINRTNCYLHEAADELNAFLLYHQIKNPILYGHSDGGSIALIYQAVHQGAKAIITEAAHVINEDETIQGVEAARPLLQDGKMEGLRKYHGERYKEVFYAWNDIWLDESFKNWDITELLLQIDIPILAIQGKDDQYGTLKQLELISSHCKGITEKFVPNTCGHAPFKEHTELVKRKVIQFLAKYGQ